MYKVFFIVLAVILFLITAGLSLFCPKMHKNMLLYDSGLKIVLHENEADTTQVIPAKINPVAVKINTAAKKTTVIPVDTTVNTHTEIVNTPVNTENKNIVKPESVNIQPQRKETPAPLKQTAPVKKNQTSPVSKPQPAVKTQAEIEQEEIVLWNKWRSDLQNRIMSDVKLPIVKQGTIFKFSFDVDKYGKITNISTWSTDANYTPFAIQYIAPVIRSYQGRDFMNFPAGSNRITTTVSGAWKISDKTTYSKPSDYQDVEKIRD